MTSIELVKKRIIIGMCALVILILTLFGITYAYFAAKVKENEEEKSISVTAGSLRLEYNDEDSKIVMEKIKPGADSKTKIFSVTNTGTREIESYDVYLENIVNELKYYEDLTYELTCKSYKTEDYKSNKTDATETGTCNGSASFFPKYDSTIVSNSIDAGITHYYLITVTYNETNRDQSADMNKKVSALVNIKDDEYSYNKFNVYGNFETVLAENSTEISPSTPATYNFLGTLVTDEKDSNYDKYKIDIIAGGKNILDPSNLSDFDLQTDGSYLSNKIIKTDSNIIENLKGVYTVSALVKAPVGKNYRIKVNYTDGTYTDSYKASTGEYISISLTTNGKDIERIYWTYTSFSNEVQFKNLQIEKGDTITSYESYVEPITYSIYLNEPLRCIDNVCDYVDLVNKKVYRKIGAKVFDGNEDWRASGDAMASGYSGFVVGFDAKKATKILNTHFVSAIYSNNNFTSWANSTAAFNFRVTIESSIASTLEEWKEWLSINKPTVYYELNEVDDSESVMFIETSLIANKVIRATDGNLDASNIELETMNNLS